MQTNIKLPIEDCDLEVRVGTDGVWLHFGKHTMIHVHNVLGGGHGIIQKQIDQWCIDRQNQVQPEPRTGAGSLD
jgi:hypothetical protein